MTSTTEIKSRVKGDVLLVGSLPYPNSEMALREAAQGVGQYVACLTDGEPGERQFWVQYLPEFIFTNHPDLVETHHPQFAPDVQPVDEEGVQRGAGEPFWWTFAIKEGVKDLRFDLGYGDFALESYKIFAHLQGEGEIPATSLW